MDFDEFLKKNGVVEKGFYPNSEYFGLENVVGKRVWICDYRNNNKDVFNKPIRFIKPIYVEVCLPTKERERVYYSPIHFKEVGNNEKLLSKVIAPYDNTGYRTYKGVSLNIFYREDSCKVFFQGQIDNAIDEIKKAEKRHLEYVNSRLDSLLKLRNL